MKKILLLTSATALAFLSSCTSYGTYGYAPVGNPGFIGGGYAPLQVGFVATNYSQWAWDPYRRAYFDRGLGRYWNINTRGYYSVAPRRYATAFYPSGYRTGGRINAPSYLPRRSSGSINRGGSVKTVGVNNNRNRYTPVIHGSSRGSTSIKSNVNSNRKVTTNRSYQNRSTPTRTTTSRQPTPSRTTTNRGTSNSSRYQTISSGSNRGSATSSRSVSGVKTTSYPSRANTSRTSTSSSTKARSSSSSSKRSSSSNNGNRRSR